MLEEVGASYALHGIDLRQGEHGTPAHLAVNPFGRLPDLLDNEADGQLVYRTLAVCYYPAEKHGTLLPRDLAARGVVHQRAALASNDLGPAFAGHLLATELAPERVDRVIDAYEGLARRMLGFLEQRLGDAPFLGGEEYSVADVLAYPSVATSAARMSGGLGNMPALAPWRDRVADRPAVMRGMEAAVSP